MIDKPQNLPVKTPKFTITLSGTYTSTIIYGVAQFLKTRRAIRGITAIVGLASIAFAVTGFLGLKLIDTQPAYYLFVILGGGILYIVTISGDDFRLVFPTKQASEERRQAEKIVETSDDPNDLLSLDYKRLNEYYIINQSQARTSFRWAIFALFIGFTTIIAGIWIFYLGREVPDTFMASLSTAAGIVANLISGLFLYLHQKTQDRSLLYFHQLSEIQRIGIAVRLVDSYEDKTTQVDARNRVIDRLLDPSSKRVLEADDIKQPELTK